MSNIQLLKVSQNLIKLRDKKERQLKRRAKREKELQQLADKEYKVNREQWEALNECIKHQQDKSIILICDLLTIKKLLDNISYLQKERQNEWYA
jgi:hypothetical protein